METLLELEKYLEDNCYSFTEITIGKHYAPEGYLIDNHISFERNDIPNYSNGKPVYRMYVFGRDVLLLEEFKKKYYKI